MRCIANWPGHGLPWTARRVESHRRNHGIPGYAPARGDGLWLTMRDAAARLGVPNQAVRQLIQRGLLPATQVMPDAPWQIRTADLDTDAIREALRARRTSPRPKRTLAAQGRADNNPKR